MPLTPGTVTLTNLGTTALQLDSVGSYSVEQPTLAQFLVGGLRPIFVVQQDRESTFSTTTTIAYNSVGWLDLDAGLSLVEEVVSPTISGAAAAASYAGIAVLSADQRLTLNNFTGTGTGFQVNWDSAGSGVMVQQGAVAALGTSLPFAPNAMYPFAAAGHVCVVVDGQGTVFDTAAGTYATATFFPLLNEAGNAPATATTFAGGFTDTVGLHSYFAVINAETVSPFTLLPPLIEETANGASVAVYEYAFNNSLIPGNVFEIAGTTPNGFFFVAQGSVVEINPAAKTYAVFNFTPEDTVAAECLDVATSSAGTYAATRDNSGAWWFTNSANAGSSCSGGQFNFSFAKSSIPGPPAPTEDCCVPLPSPTLGRYRGNAGLNCYGQTLIGDAFSGVIGVADFNSFQEYGNTMWGQIAAPPIHSDRKRIFIPRFEIDVESGVGMPECCGFDPAWVLDWSKDGGRTWSALQIPRSMGKIGQYTQRLRWLRLGQARQWIFRLTSTDPVRRTIIGTYLDSYEGMG